MAIKKDFVITKRNVLNELRANSMSLQELRFFSIYLSKINSKDLNTRVVRFPLSDFQKIMELDRLNIDYLKHVTDSLLCKIVHIPLNEKGGYTAFQLFKECSISMDKCGEWYVEIDAHDKALPLMFEFKNRYFTYQLWNALRLKSSNQLRMYEILKQYEKVGERIISISELKELLGIKKNEYERYGNLKIYVLLVCQKALKENTDIQFTFEPTGRKGPGGKILNLKFKIMKNNEYMDQLSLSEFIDLSPEPAPVEPNYKSEKLSFYADACNNEFSLSEIQVIFDLTIEIIPYSNRFELDVYDYINRKYNEFLLRSEKSKITHRFGYFKKMIESEMP